MINWIDILLLAIIALYAFIGWRRGFILGVIDLIAWLGSLIVSFLLFPYVAVAIQKMFPSLGAWVNIVSFLFTFLVIRLVVSLLFSLFIAQIPARVQASGANKLLGILPGLFNGVVTAAIIALLLMVLPWTDGLATQTRNSKVADELTRPAAWIEDKVSPAIDSVINKTVAGLMVDPGSPESVKLPFTTTHFTIRADLETQMLQLVNEERAKEGLQPLQADTALTSVARAHSKDMFERGYFSHYTPEGKNPFQRLHDAGITFLAAGENLALAQTLHIAHNGLMHSPGHRANILNPVYKKVGIGIIEGGMHGLMISQEFKN